MKKQTSIIGSIHHEVPIEYINNIIESLDQNIVVVDINEHIVLWNTKMTENFFQGKNVYNKPLRKFFPGFWDEFKNKNWGNIFVKQVLQEGNTEHFNRFPLKILNNKIRYFDLKGTPLRDQSKKILGAILVMNDVTDNILLENQLLRQARTTSLADLGANIAHEIRNPLNSIYLNIQLVKECLQIPDETSKEELLESLEHVLSEIDRLNDLIRYFLRFSKPPDPQLSLDDPNASVEQVMKLLSQQAKQSYVEIITNLSKLPKLPIDKNQLSQAIYNICLNAIQAMTEFGGGKLEISTFHNPGYVMIEIKDNGPGFENGTLDNLFDLFFSTKEYGSGLGLPIANQIIEKHDGKIVAENNIDHGACFSIYLPT